MSKQFGATRYLASLTILIFALGCWSWAQDTTTQDSTTPSDHASKSHTKTAAETSKAAGQQTDIEKRLNTAATVIDEIMNVPEKGIPQDAFTSAKCVVVIPSMVRIALMFGGERGKGVATCHTANGWSAPAPIDLTGGSWGLQAGGEAIDLVMLVMSQKGMDALLTNKFKIGADASGAAGPIGRQASGSTDWKFKSDMLTYSRARGVFAGINLNGAVVKQGKDETAILYGKIVPFTTILSGSLQPPAAARPFLAAVRKYAAEARETKQTGALAPPSE
jgi:lipid-binding SYLF domain-containing protein